jgi:hypothetical protein
MPLFGVKLFEAIGQSIIDTSVDHTVDSAESARNTALSLYNML